MAVLKHPTPAQRQLFEQLAFEIRRLCLEFITTSGWGHIGGSFSQAELLACLYGGVLQIDPQQPADPQRDRFILSKAHTSPALYAILALRGFIPLDRLTTYCRLGGLDGHTQRGQCPGIEYSGGSLGTGLSYALGVAQAQRLRDNFRTRVYCLLGDGECNEGQIWEAAMAASHYRLDNLIAIVDYNKVMAKGKLSDLMPVEPLADKFRSFGWAVQEADGHDIDDLCLALHRARYLEMHGKPNVLIAHTCKGRGIPEAEFNYHWHTHAPSPAQAQAFLADLAQTYGRDGVSFSRPLTVSKDGGLEGAIRADLKL